MARSPDPSDIPALVKHVTMRIASKPFAASHPPGAWVPPARSKEQERFIIAFAMAINALSRQGYVAMGSSPAPGERISLTGRGQEKEKTHSKDNPGSSSGFDSLYREAFAPAEERDPPPGRGAGGMPLSRPGETAPHVQPLAATKRRVIQRKEQRDLEARTTLGKLKSGIRRAKRAVAKVAKVARAITHRKPKGRV